MAFLIDTMLIYSEFKPFSGTQMILKSTEIKAIIFDFDGVIFNSEPIHWEAYQIIFQQIGFDFPYSEYLTKYVGVADVEMFPLIFADKGLTYQQHEIKHFIGEKIKVYERIIHSAPELKSIQGLSQFLADSKKIISQFAICSGSSRTELETTLSKLENGSLKTYFNFITTSEDVSANKPSPEGYLKTAAKLNIPPEQCLVIEDTNVGIKAAKAANMKVVGIATTNKIESLLGADLVVDSYEKIAFAQY